MVTRFYFILLVFFIFSCSNKDQPFLDQEEKSPCAEQTAVNFLFQELVNQDSLFYVKEEKGELVNLLPPTFLEDSLFVDGLFYWKKIYMSDRVNTLSAPLYDVAFMAGIAPEFLEKDEIDEAEEFLADAESKKKLALPEIAIELPKTISVVKTNHFENKYLANSLYLRVGHKLESKNRFLIEISVYNLEYDEYKSIIIFTDKQCNVVDWKMP